MPIDPSIALSFKPAQFADPLEAQARRQQIQSNALAMRSQQSALERQNALAQRFAQGGDFSSPEFISDIMKIDPDKGMQLQQFGVQMGRDKAATAVSEADLAEKNQKIARRKIVDTGLAFMNALNGDASDEHITQVGAQLKSSGYSDDDVAATLQPIMALPPEKRTQAIRSQILQSEEGQKALALVMPKIEKIDTGGKIIFRDVNPDSPTANKEFGSIAKTASPDAIMAAASSADRLAQDAAQFTVTTGLKREELGQKGGDFLSKLSKAEQKDYRSLVATDKTVDAALARIEKTPTAFGFSKGAATSVGGVTGGRMGASIVSSQMTDDEIQARSFVYNIVSAAIKERAGTAQSAQELKVLDGFLPSPFDDSRVIKAKLKAFKQFINTKREGYEPADGAGAAPAASSPPRLTPEQAKKLAPGTTFIGTDGVERTTR
jgi:hypothetical protein